MQHPEIGKLEQLEPNVRRIIAPNPSPMTYWGTNTYLVGKDSVAVIDPGPLDDGHLHAIVRSAKQISHIICTHAHLDHTASAKELSHMTGAQVYAYGPAERGQTDMMKRLVAQGLTSGGEGVDHDFRPDVQLEDGQTLTGEDWQLEVIWTPGHCSNHIALALDQAVFSGDHVMEWATSIVSPPDGDMSAFYASCARFLARKDDRIYYPGHGLPVVDPAGRVNWLLAHRKEREGQILDHLRSGSASPRDLVDRIYVDIPEALKPAAERNIFAHLIDLHQRELVVAQGEVTVAQKYTRIG